MFKKCQAPILNDSHEPMTTQLQGRQDRPFPHHVVSRVFIFFPIKNFTSKTSLKALQHIWSLLALMFCHCQTPTHCQDDLTLQQDFNHSTSRFSGDKQ